MQFRKAVRKVIEEFTIEELVGVLEEEEDLFQRNRQIVNAQIFRKAQKQRSPSTIRVVIEELTIESSKRSMSRGICF